MDFTKNPTEDSIRCIWCGSKQPEDSHNENMTDITYVCDKCISRINTLNTFNENPIKIGGPSV